MSTSLSSLTRTCVFCASSLERASLLPQTQKAFRSTKAGNKQIYLVAQLKQPYPLWGPEGTYIRVTPGFMRNVLYPKKVARYIVGEELKKLLASDRMIQRDRSFMDARNPVQETKVATHKERTVPYFPGIKSTSTVSAERAQIFLQTLVPRTLIFERRLNPTALARQQHADADVRGMPIYGSVTTTDIAQAIKEFLTRDKEAGGVIVDAQDIRVTLGLPEEQLALGKAKLTVLGKFMVDIALGSHIVVEKEVEIRPLDDGVTSSGPLGRNVANVREQRTEI